MGQLVGLKFLAGREWKGFEKPRFPHINPTELVLIKRIKPTDYIQQLGKLAML
jgi:hypothetical protein